MNWLTYQCYRWAQWRHSFGKRKKDARFRAEPFTRLIQARVPELAAPGSPAPILSLGTRNGSELDAMREAGWWNVVGFDLFPNDPRILRGDLHRLPFPDGTFVLVYASHVFEHAHTPTLAIQEAWRVLRPAGWLFAAFPIGFRPTAHDRVDFESPEGFLDYTDGKFDLLWSETRPGEALVLVRRQ